MLRILFNTILILLLLVVCIMGVSLLVEIALIEKFQIKGPDTNEETIYLSTSDRYQEILIVSRYIKYSLILCILTFCKIFYKKWW